MSGGTLPPHRPWTDAKLRLLRDLYPDLHTETVARELGLSVSAIHNKAYQLGLRKSAGFKTAQGHLRAEHNFATHFQKGHAPWNKDLKGSTGTQEGCRRTQFKKGEMHGAAQHNYRPIGGLRVSGDGYLERKVSDDPYIHPARRWVGVHRLVWQQAHGPIAKGRIVVFRPGQKTTVLEEITVDRLECITRAQNALRNHPRSRDPELGYLVTLKGAITRQVNRITREARERAEAQAPGASS